jgi:hypothetical protein
MSMPNLSYAMPTQLAGGLDRVVAYWKGLRRGENDIPFADDVRLSALKDDAALAMLVDVLERPLRFRFAIVGERIVKQYGDPLVGQFSHEIALRPPFDALDAQLATSVERGVPTFFRHGAAAGGARGYARIILPLWGNGRVQSLLGAVATDGG